MMLTTHFHVAPKLMSGNMPVHNLCAFVIWTGSAFLLNVSWSSYEQ